MRGVEFVLLEEDETSLRKAGANDLLIKAIFENLTAEFKEKFKQDLYSTYMTNGTDKSLEQRKEKVRIAKQFIRLFGDSKEDKEVVDYFKRNLPIIEKTIAEAEAEQSASERLQINNQKNLNTKFDKERLKLNEIIEKLNKISDSEDEQKLVKEICEHGADFALNSENEKSLRDAGASDLLIKVIRERFDTQKEKERIYELFVNNYSGNSIEKIKLAIKAGKKYLEKFEYSECYPDDPLIPYFKENIPNLEQLLKKFEPCNYPGPSPERARKAERFNKAIANKNWDELFIVGAEIIEDKTIYSLDVAIILATIGYDQAKELKEKSKYNDKAIYYAELAIKLMEEGKKSDTEKFGANFGKGHIYQYKTKDFPNGKENALGWMNYIIGYIKYFRQNQKDEAVPYFYNAVQFKSQVKNSPEPYQAIGDWYVERAEKETNATFKTALLERAIDAYARAFSFAQDFKFDKSKTNLYNKLTELLVERYGNETNIESKIEEIVSRTKNEQLPRILPIR